MYGKALFVVDDMPIYDNTYAPIASMPASVIASVTVLPGQRGFGRYGSEAIGGVIFVTTKAWSRINDGATVDDEVSNEINLLKRIRIFRTEVEYNIPSKEEVELNPVYQIRPTLLWESDVYLDGTGPVEIKYPNNIGKGTVLVFVNCVSFTNLVGTNRYSYKVK
jgi:hypothetical protein